MSHTAQILGFVTYKGGVGKTTLSTFIGCSFARGLGNRGRPMRVLVIDMDPQANATFMLLRDMYLGYINEGEVYPSMNDVLLRNMDIREVIQTAALEANPRYKFPAGTIDVAPAIDGMRETADLISTKSKSDERLSFALRSVVGSYDLIIVDSPPTGGLLTRNVIEASHNVVIPLMPGQSEYDCVGQTLEAVLEINSFRDDEEQIGLAGILPNRFGRTVVSREFRELLKAEYEGFVLPEIPDLAVIPKVTNSGYDPVGYATDQRSYDQLVPTFESVCEAILNG